MSVAGIGEGGGLWRVGGVQEPTNLDRKAKKPTAVEERSSIFVRNLYVVSSIIIFHGLSASCFKHFFKAGFSISVNHMDCTTQNPRPKNKFIGPFSN